MYEECFQLLWSWNYASSYKNACVSNFQFDRLWLISWNAAVKSWDTPAKVLGQNETRPVPLLRNGVRVLRSCPVYCSHCAQGPVICSSSVHPSMRAKQRQGLVHSQLCESASPVLQQQHWSVSTARPYPGAGGLFFLQLRSWAPGYLAKELASFP